MTAEPSKIPLDPRQREKWQAEKELESKLLEGFSSQERIEVDDEFFKKRIRRFIRNKPALIEEIDD